MSFSYKAYIIIAFAVILLAAIYLAAGLQASGTSTPVMPLDDVYIHFQYARALAQGHPLQYNPDQPATSGATSLLYPFILAVGYVLGFQGERLSWWAIGIGILSWIGSAWLVYKIVDYYSTGINPRDKRIISFALTLSFILTGSLGWAFVSGMETGLMIFGTLLTLWAIVNEDRRGVIAFGTLTVLIRPEGLIIGGLAALYMATHEPTRKALMRHVPLYAIPFAVGAIQPVLNLMMTGSATASGLQAKSYLYNVPPDSAGILTSVVNTGSRIWTELLTGFNPDAGQYGTTIVFVLAMACIVMSLWQLRITKKLSPPILVLGWLVAITPMIAVLETAFWQMKRYQQPMIALLFPVAGWLLLTGFRTEPHPQPLSKMERGESRWIVWPATLLILIMAILTLPGFVRMYADNVREVAFSQMQMARYVAEKIPAGAIIGVHDIGVMRYLGEHPTYDVVGLTTPGEARAWRNGPGSVFEQMLHSPWRPDYFAIYSDARGLDYFVKTGLFRETLATFPSTQPPYNVASATSSGQAVYRADWTFAAFADKPWQPTSLEALAAQDGSHQVDSVNVADLASEDAHQYRWWQAAKGPGFATEVYEQSYVSCAPPLKTAENPTCKVLDGGRLITGGEEMTIATEPGKDLLWIMRVHPRDTAEITIFVNGGRGDSRLIPAIPGQWLEITMYIPGTAITGYQTHLRVEANITDPAAGHYMPYYHWFFQGHVNFNFTPSLPGPGATFGSSIKLAGRRLTYHPESRTISLTLEWDRGGWTSYFPLKLIDAKIFVHVYDKDGKIVVQADQRPGDGTLPPANWLPGVRQDTFTLTIPADTPPGTYRVAIGLYDPVTSARLPVIGEGSDQDNRLFIGTVEIEK